MNDILLTSPKAPKWSQVVICDEFVTIFIWSQNWHNFMHHGFDEFVSFLSHMWF
jgi:hypothetical protein